MSTHPTKRRTFTRQQIEESREAWDAGRFSPEWKPWRHLAAMEAGIILPPKGTPLDQWDDDEPSERALLIRAIRETPSALRRAICSPGVHSWSAVVALVTRNRDRLAEAADRRDADWQATKARPTPIGDTLATILDSLGGDR